MSRIKPPTEFDFQKPSTWPEWRKRFDRYVLASKLNAEAKEVQISTLVYSMGSEAEKIFGTFETTADTTLAEVLEKYDNYFNPRVNVIHERAVFHSRQQGSSETVESYLRALYDLAEHCAFDKKEETIRDRLVVGLRDRELSEKLQLQAELTLADAVKQARQHEQVKHQLQEQRPAGHVDAAESSNLQYRQGARGRARGQRSRGPRSSGPARGGRTYSGAKAPNHPSCTRCGRSHKQQEPCPARGQRCRKCGKLGHFAAMCRTGRSVNELEEEHSGFLDSMNSVEMEEPNQQPIYFLGTVVTDTEPWTTDIKIKGSVFTFKIDTGADVSVMSAEDYKKLHPSPKLQPPNTTLKSPGGIVQCMGKFETEVELKNEQFQFQIFVVKGTQHNLLSRDAAFTMGLVKRVEAVGPLFGELDDRPADCPPVKITLQKDAQPYSVHTARRIPIPLIEKVEEELKRMEKAEIIQKITEPTDWCAPIIPVMKKNGKVRICTDLRKLNAAVKRERYVLPTIDHMLHKLEGSTVFSKLDATSGYWQIPLDESTAKLTTFITPSGRYYYKRLPFGISSAPEIFQRTMEEILKDEPNVICFYDDILVYSKNERDHEIHLQRVFDKLKSVNLKLNHSKCQLRKSEVEFLGHRVTKDGIFPDPSKVEAIINMPDPQNVHELRRILGMVNFLGRYIPHLSTTLQPVNELLEADKAWTWGPAQAEALQTVKRQLSTAPTLAFFDLSKPTVVSADASSYGLGGVLLQEVQGELKPVAYCSRSLTSTEKRYAQIEKECLATVWACDKFSRYLLGLHHFKVMTDHKPLIPLMNNKDLQDCPVRCQRMLMRLMRFHFTAEYLPGKKMIVADTLSRSPQETTSEGETVRLEEDVEMHVNAVRATWPATDNKLEQIAEESQKDPLMQAAIRYTREGWPRYEADVEVGIRDLYQMRAELSENNGLLLRGNRIIVPQSLRKEVVEKIHAGHQGINKCRERAKLSVWWPGINEAITRIVENCQHCQERRPTQKKEPLIPTELPDRPFQKVAADLCEHEGENYLVLIDYYSRYLEIAHLSNMTASTVIYRVKNIFARHGVPETLFTDNGSQFTSTEFQQFSAEWGFSHVTSSPHHPQSNGEAERAVQLAKKILDQDDVFQGLLAYRATPSSATGRSPAELLFGRQLRTSIPTLPQNLQPATVKKKTVEKTDRDRKKRNQRNYDAHHGARPLPELKSGDKVWQKLDKEKKWGNPGTVVKQLAPRSYLVETPKGKVCRNRRHLRQAHPVYQGASRAAALNPDLNPTSTPLPMTNIPLKIPPPVSIIQRPEAGASAHMGAPSTADDDPAVRQPPEPPDASGRILPSPSTSSPPRRRAPQRGTTSPVTPPVPRPTVTRSGRQVVVPARYQD